MTGEGQSHCLDPKGSCPGKGDTDPTAKHPALPCSGNTTTRAGLGPAPDCQGMVLCLPPLSAGLPCHSPGHQTRRGQEESGVSHSISPALEDKEPQGEGRGRAERFGVGRGEVWPVCRLSALGQTPDRPRSRRELNPHHLQPWRPHLARGQRRPPWPALQQPDLQLLSTHRGKAESIRKRPCYSKVTYLRCKTTTSPFSLSKGI